MNTETTNTRNDNVSAAIATDVERFAQDLVAIGRAWAAHGLAVGRSALATSARSLEVGARWLDDVARRFEAKAESKPEPREQA